MDAPTEFPSHGWDTAPLDELGIERIVSPDRETYEYHLSSEAFIRAYNAPADSRDISGFLKRVIDTIITDNSGDEGANQHIPYKVAIKGLKGSTAEDPSWRYYLKLQERGRNLRDTAEIHSGQVTYAVNNHRRNIETCCNALLIGGMMLGYVGGAYLSSGPALQTLDYIRQWGRIMAPVALTAGFGVMTIGACIAGKTIEWGGDPLIISLQNTLEQWLLPIRHKEETVKNPLAFKEQFYNRFLGSLAGKDGKSGYEKNTSSHDLSKLLT